MRMRCFLAVLALAAAPAPAQHAGHEAAPRTGEGATGRPALREWTRAPLLLPVRAGERGAALLRLAGIEAAAVELFAADGPPERRRISVPVGPEGVRIAPATPGLGNYHWLVARQEAAGVVRVASTAWYFSNPGKAPTELLRRPKHELEIVPDPLPREHAHYRESEKWRFLLRYEGRPLAGQALTLETEFGSRLQAVSDAQGVATVVFPRDYRPAPPEAEGAHGPRRAKFVLHTRFDADGRVYETAFNSSYAADPGRNRSLPWGAAFGLAGMAAALPLLRRRAQPRGEQNA